MSLKVVLFSFLFVNAVLSQETTVTPSPTTEIPDPTTETDPPIPVKTTTPEHETTTPAVTTTDGTTPLPTTEESTTPEPTTAETTTLEPTTTPAPAPEWKAGNWSVTDESKNSTCIIAHMAVGFKVSYETGKGNSTAIVMVPPEAEAKGSCGSDNQTLALVYPSGAGTNTIAFLFKSSGTASKNFIISSIEITYVIDAKNFPNASKPGKVESVEDSKVDLFMTQVGKSYKCQSKIEIGLNDEKSNANATMMMKDAQIEAFRTTEDEKFGVAVLCSADEFTSDIVPIAVGCALAALVVIVIIAYLIGRRRARAKGYQSM